MMYLTTRNAGILICDLNVTYQQNNSVGICLTNCTNLKYSNSNLEFYVQAIIYTHWLNQKEMQIYKQCSFDSETAIFYVLSVVLCS